MQPIDQTIAPDAVREFRRHLERLQWDTNAFARAARIKVRSAGEMYRGERAVPDKLMGWLRSMVATADALPPPPCPDI
jgi:hypothetical protein